MHHPEQFKGIVKQIHEDRLNEGLISQAVSRNKPDSFKGQKAVDKLRVIGKSIAAPTRSVVNRISTITLNSKNRILRHSIWSNQRSEGI